jgi:hypothetical protein
MIYLVGGLEQDFVMTFHNKKGIYIYNPSHLTNSIIFLRGRWLNHQPAKHTAKPDQLLHSITAG